MLVYKVRKTEQPPSLKGLWDEPVWRKAGTVEIVNFRRESSDHRPATSARMLHGHGSLYCIFKVEDTHVRSVVTDFNGPVCKDSCVEFFFKPREDRGYFNVEINAGGTLHMSYIVDPARSGDGFKGCNYLSPEEGRMVRIYHSLPAVIDPAIEGPTRWFVEFSIPIALPEKFTGPLGKLSGQEWRANFYKCGDKTSHPHWAAWSPVRELNFHMPDCFGTIVFE